MRAQPALEVSRRWKFGKVPTEVLASEMTIFAKMAFAVLDWHGDTAFPSYRRMARMMGCSMMSVRRGVAELEREGWLSRHRRAGTTPLYRLGVPCSVRTDPLFPENRAPRRPCSHRTHSNDTSDNRDRRNYRATRTRKRGPVPAWAREFVKAGGELTDGT